MTLAVHSNLCHPCARFCNTERFLKPCPFAITQKGKNTPLSHAKMQSTRRITRYQGPLRPAADANIPVSGFYRIRNWNMKFRNHLFPLTVIRVALSKVDHMSSAWSQEKFIKAQRYAAYALTQRPKPPRHGAALRRPCPHSGDGGRYRSGP